MVYFEVNLKLLLKYTNQWSGTESFVKMQNKERTGQLFIVREGIKVYFPAMCQLFSAYVHVLIHSSIQQIEG